MARDKKGRWPKGTSGNPKGRPRRQFEQNYLDLTVANVSQAEWKKVVRKAVGQAVEGDYRARQWLSDRLIGSATAYLEANISGGYTESAFIELLSVMDGLVPDEHREAYEESLKALSDKMEKE